MTISKYIITIGLLGLLAVFVLFIYPSGCHYPVRGQLRIDTVKYGEFVEWIPQNGIIERDTINVEKTKVIVTFDELYLSRVAKGLLATTSISNQEFQLLITNVYPKVVNGSFQVEMNFNGQIPNMPSDPRIRLRVYLSEPSNELLLPLGDFFTQTRGKWVFVVGEDNRAIKRNVNLGRRTFYCFEVKGGLKSGDRVVTSSYEKFIDRDSIDISEIAKLYY